MNSNEKPRDYDYDIPEQAEEAWDKLANWYSARKKGSYEFKIQRARRLSKTESPGRDLNPRPTAYEAAALPG